MSNRVLHTVYLDSAPAERLRDEINLIIERYSVEIKGVISDKQGNIVSCMRRYFPEIPHQFYSFHFAQNLWNHLELKDGVLFKTLSKMLKQSYFMNLTPTQEVFFEEHGKLKPRDVFEPIILDIKRMRRIRMKKFETLRSLQLFEEIDNYCAEMYAAALRIPEGCRMRLIFMGEFEKWSQTLMEVYQFYDEVFELYDLFGEIYHNLFSGEIKVVEKKKSLIRNF